MERLEERHPLLPLVPKAEPRTLGAELEDVSVPEQGLPDALEELFDLVGLVCGQIIQNDVNLLARRAAGDDLFEETDELRAGVPLGSLALHLAGLYIQGRVQRQRAITPILEAVPFQPSG